MKLDIRGVIERIFWLAEFLCWHHHLSLTLLHSSKFFISMFPFKVQLPCFQCFTLYCYDEFYKVFIEIFLDAGYIISQIRLNCHISIFKDLRSDPLYDIAPSAPLIKVLEITPVSHDVSFMLTMCSYTGVWSAFLYYV